MNKKLTLIFLALFLLTAGVLGAQTALLDKTVATVNLTKTEGISLIQLNQTAAELAAVAQAQTGQPANVDKRQVLDMMIADILINQAVERANIRATEEEINTFIQNQKSQFEQQNNATLTDAQFRTLVEQQSRITWNEFREQVKTQIVQQKFLMQQKADMIAAARVPPSAQEVETFYRRNRNSFSNPEIVRISQIYISTQGLDAAQRQGAKTRADDIYRKYQNGSSFEQLVLEYSDDTQSRYRQGDIGFLAINDTDTIQLLGQAFVDQAFALVQGQVSRVISTPAGYHIIKVTESHPARLLTLDDPVNPSSTGTVREYIQQVLIMQKSQVVFQQALESLVNDLKAEADISIFEENLK